jgi:hypothetical protein
VFPSEIPEGDTGSRAAALLERHGRPDTEAVTLRHDTHSQAVEWDSFPAVGLDGRARERAKPSSDTAADANTGDRTPTHVNKRVLALPVPHHTTGNRADQESDQSTDPGVGFLSAIDFDSTDPPKG